MTVVGVDFALLDADESLRADFEFTCRKTVAEKAGVPVSVVEVQLSQGSVVILATIRVPSSSPVTVEEVVSGLQTDGGIGASIVSSVTEVSGIEEATDGSAISAADVQVAAVEPAPREMYTTSTGPKVGVQQGSLLVLALASAGVACALALLMVCFLFRRRKARAGGAGGIAPPTAAASKDLEAAVPAAEVPAAVVPLEKVADALVEKDRVRRLDHRGSMEEVLDGSPVLR